MNKKTSFTATVASPILAAMMIAGGAILLIIMIPFVLVKETVEEIKFRRKQRRK